MGLKVTLSESNIDKAKNTSDVTAKVIYYGNGTSFNNNKQSGSLTLNGTTYSFSHSFTTSTSAQTLYTKKVTVEHNSDGTKTVSASAKFNTGVSLGTLKASASLKLTSIARTWTVSYNANGGSGAPSSQTKKYGVTLVLSSTKPTRYGYTFKGWATSSTGSVAYNSGGSYTSNSAVTLYAVWSENTAVLTIKNNGKGSVDSTRTMKTTAIMRAPSSWGSEVGYTLEGWATSSTGGVVYSLDTSSSSNIIKAANVSPTATTIYAVWGANTHTAYFNLNGGTIGGSSSLISVPVTYDKTFIINVGVPTLDEYHSFVGWRCYIDDEEQIYQNNQSFTWTFDSDITFVAVYSEEKRNVSLYKHLDTSDNFTSNVDFIYSEVIRASYKKPLDLSSKILPNSGDYKFTGYWSVGSPYKVSSSSNYGIVYPAGVLPYNFTSPVPGGVGDGLVNQIASVESNINLYAVYKDNTKSLINFEVAGYNYVDAAISSYDFDDYFNYLTTGDSGEFNFTASSDKFYGYFKFKTTNPRITISDAYNIIIANKDGSEVLSSIEISDVFTYVKSGVTYYYILFTNTAAVTVGSAYIATLNNLRDVLTKPIATTSDFIIPPKVIWDVNDNSNCFSLFGKAPEFNEAHSKVLLLNGSNLYIPVSNTDKIKSSYYEIINGKEYVKLADILVAIADKIDLLS